MDANEKELDNSLESTMNMSQDDIEKLLLQFEGDRNVDNSAIDDLDLEDLLAGFDEKNNGAIQDISELLAKSDQNQAVDEEVVALLKSQEEEGLTAYDAMDLFSGEVETKKEGFWTKLIGKLKKAKKEKSETLPKEKKKKKKAKKSKEKRSDKERIEDWEEIDLQDVEAYNIQDNSMNDALSLLAGSMEDDNASETSAKEKKSKDKDKKGAKSTEEEEIKEKPKKKGKKKEKKEKNKAKKEKKEKKSKKDSAEIREKVKEKGTIADAILELEAMEEEPPHKKKVLMIFVASILIMLGFLVVIYYFTGHSNKRLAEEAYEDQDYLECYQLLYGQKMNDSQRAMYKRSECILKTEIFWRDYHSYMKEEKWLEGLDELTQYVYQYPKALEDAEKWNGQELIKETYEEVQGLLEKEYETSSDVVAEIAELESDADYTRSLLTIVKEKEKREALNKKYPDILPEEKDRLSQ